ncbi:hypothetical protein OYC64_018994 [Pagothenia borchgrevinki]|uniref:Ig-like domain-containing protein n=1 Tax=Pagothenia borchgrevinki TaxID=8213 RepID=A0ABD2GRD1_PAGBO
MRTFLAVFIVFTVSADKHVTINGTPGHDVLLPCACSGRNVSREVKWQTEGPNVTQMFNHTQTTETFWGKYKERGKAFLSENRENCSILLTNITAEDQRKYRCIFSINETYKKSFVTLNISDTNIHFQPVIGKHQRRSYCFYIPIMFVLGLSLLLWCRRTVS